MSSNLKPQELADVGDSLEGDSFRKENYAQDDSQIPIAAVEDDNNSGENGDEVKDLPKKKETKLGGLNKLDKNMMSGYGIMNTYNSEIDRINDLTKEFRTPQNKATRTQRLIEIFSHQMENDEQNMLADAFHMQTKQSTIQLPTQAITTPGEKQKPAKKILDEPTKKFIAMRNKQLMSEQGIDVESILAERKKNRKKTPADDTQQRGRFIANEHDDWKFYWDLFVLVVAVWNSLSIPVAIAFVPQWSIEGAYVYVDIGTNFLFLFDIILAFNTSYYDVEGEEIRGRGKIAMHYIKGAFFIDVISTIPFDLINESLKLLSMLKVIRITRLTKIINKLGFEEETKAYIKIVRLVFLLFLVMHILGCFWFIVISAEKEWIPPLDFIYAGTPKIKRFYDETETDVTYRYLVSLYCAVLALGGNEMGPRTDFEITTMIMILLGCTIFNANIFGEMTVLVQMGSRKATGFQEQVDVANTAMKNINLPQEAQQKVRTYLITTQGTHHEQIELKKFINMISPSLKVKVAVSIFAKIVRKNTRLNKFVHDLAKVKLDAMRRVQDAGHSNTKIVRQIEESYIKIIVSRMSTELVQPDFVVVDQFAEGTAMYLIAKGECQVVVGDENNDKTNKQNDKFLRPGQYFGEISLVYGCKCTAKVFAKKYCTLAMLSKEKFREVSTQIPSLLEELQQGIYEYDDRMLRFIKRSMKSVPYFANLSDPCLYDIIYSLKTEKFQKDEVLQKPGADATSLYFLQNGIIEVYTVFENKEFVLERLFRGSIINYRTFFMEEHGQVFLRFSTQSVMQELPYNQMMKICSKYPDLNKIFNRYKLQIIKDSKPIPLDYIMVLPKRITRKIAKQSKKKLIVRQKEEIEYQLKEKKREMARQEQTMSQQDQKDFYNNYIDDQHVTDHLRTAFKLENLLKNVVIRKLAKIREIKNKKSLKESVQLILKQNQEAEAKKRRKLKKKIMRQYENDTSKNQEDQDGLYNRIMVNMDRLLKVLTGHSQAVDSLERKLNTISATRKRPKNNITLDGSEAGAKTEQFDNLVNEEDKMFNTGQFKGLGMVDQDDQLSRLSEEDIRREQILEGLKQVAGEPDPDLMRPYRIPVDHMLQMNLNSDNESLKNISSDDSNGEVLSGDEKDEQKKPEKK